MNKTNLGEKSEEDRLYSFHEVIISALNNPKHQRTILELLGGEELYFHVLKCHFDPEVNYLFPKDLVDGIMEIFYEVDYGKYEEYIDSSEIMSGADPAAYPPDGTWSADLLEFLDHYIWVEPEGDRIGYFSDLKDAKEFGDRNWCP